MPDVDLTKGKDESPAGAEEITGFHGNPGCAKVEADWMIELLSKGGTMIEVGTYHGVTAAYIAKARPDALVVSIDPFPGWEGIDRLRNCAGAIDYYMKNRLENMRLLVGTLQDAERLFSSRSVDLVLIDGNHLYEFVRKDLASALVLLKEGGILLIHDIGREHQEQIRRAVDEFCFVRGMKIGEIRWTTARLERT